MTQPDLSSLALPDSPELPAEIEAAFMDAVWAPRAEKIREMHKARSVIAKHLLTAEEARFLLNVGVRQKHWYRQTCACVECEDLTAKLRRLSGSSRGEE